MVVNQEDQHCSSPEGYYYHPANISMYINNTFDVGAFNGPRGWVGNDMK